MFKDIFKKNIKKDNMSKEQVGFNYREKICNIQPESINNYSMSDRYILSQLNNESDIFHSEQIDPEKIDPEQKCEYSSSISPIISEVSAPLSIYDCTKENTEWFSLKGFKLECKCIDVYDGDTVTLIIPIHEHFYKKKCRLLGIDTAEIRSKDLHEKNRAFLAKKFVHEKIYNKIVKVVCDTWDKYGRLLVTIYLLDEEKSINQQILDKNLGYIYTGGTKKNISEWCNIKANLSEVEDVIL